MSDILERLENYIPGENEDDVAIRITEAAAEIRRLRQGIEDYLAGDYGRDKYFPTKHHKCPHNLFRWEGCENCIDDYFKALLADRPSP
jgi:hypothetical protein